MKRLTRFSIASLLLVTLLVALAVNFWPRPPAKPIVRTEVRGKSEITGMYYWFDDARGVIRTAYDGTWESYGKQAGRGNVISIWHTVHAIGTFDGTCYNQLQIQLPDNFAINDVFDIQIVKSERDKTFTEDDETCAAMTDCEATVFCYYNPSMHSLTDSTHGRLGAVKILAVNRKFVEIELDLIDDATMGRFPNGIPKTLELQRRTVNAR